MSANVIQEINLMHYNVAQNGLQTNDMYVICAQTRAKSGTKNTMTFQQLWQVFKQFKSLTKL